MDMHKFIQTGISIHAPRAGSDVLSLDGTIKTTIFQSTLPVRGATFLDYGG